MSRTADPHPAQAVPSLLICGLGNVLCGDDGLGIVAVSHLLRRWSPPPTANVVDGGTLGLRLLPFLRMARQLLLVDAIDDGSEPGTLVRYCGHDVVRAASLRLSVHQIGVADLLDALALVEADVDSIVLLGIVPGSVRLHVGLSQPALDALPTLVQAVAQEAAAMGHPFTAGGQDGRPLHPERDPFGLRRVGL